MTFFFTLVLFFLLFIGLGVYRSRRADTSSWLFADFAIPAWLTSVSSTATAVGGSALLLTGFMVSKHGWVGIVVDLPVGIGMFVLGLTMAKRVRQSGAATVAEYIGQHLGPRMRKYTAVFVLLTEIAWLALLLQSFAIFFPASENIDPRFFSIIALLIVVFYVGSGGQRSVYLTDVVQGTLILITLLALASLLFFDPRPRQVPTVVTLPWLDFSAYLIMMFVAGLSGPDLLGRVFYSRNGSAARRGLLWGGVAKITLSILIAAMAYEANRLGLVPADSYKLFPQLLLLYFPQPLLALSQVALLMVLLSSADTVLMTAMTTLENDLLRQRPKLMTMRLHIFILSSAALLLGLYLRDLLPIMQFAYTFYAVGPALFIIYAATGISIPARQALAIMLASGSVAALSQLAGLAGLPLMLIGVMLNLSLIIIYLLWRKLGEK
jgi:SSS family solute:Na+ symporter